MAEGTLLGLAPARARSAQAAAASAEGRREIEELVASSYRQVFRTLQRMCGDPDLAADLTQETYRRAWTAIGTWERRCAFGTWLHRIAYTTYLNHLRVRAPFVSIDELEPGAAAPDAPADQLLALRAEARRLRGAVLRLPDPLRYVVTAHYWGEIPVRELARAEGISTFAMRKRLRKAMAILEKEMRR